MSFIHGHRTIDKHTDREARAALKGAHKKKKDVYCCCRTQALRFYFVLLLLSISLTLFFVHYPQPQQERPFKGRDIFERPNTGREGWWDEAFTNFRIYECAWALAGGCVRCVAYIRVVHYIFIVYTHIIHKSTLSIRRMGRLLFQLLWAVPYGAFNTYACPVYRYDFTTHANNLHCMKRLSYIRMSARAVVCYMAWIVAGNDEQTVCRRDADTLRASKREREKVSQNVWSTWYSTVNTHAIAMKIEFDVVRRVRHHRVDRIHAIGETEGMNGTTESHRAWEIRRERERERAR